MGASEMDEDLVGNLEGLELESTIAGTVTAGDLAPEGATAVYDNYDFQPQYDPKLPITNKHDEVSDNS
jgi:hypothetical protein